MSRKKIAVFGCSWSQGLKRLDNFDNWVKHLAKKRPEHDFYNFGCSGTSIVYHAYLLDSITRREDFDNIIFQVTSPGRYTWWKPHNLNELKERQDNNYWAMPKWYGKKYVEKITFGDMEKGTLDNDKKKQKFATEYYKRLSRDQMEIEFKVYLEFVKARSDLVFFHRKGLQEGDLSVHSTLGDDKFHSFAYDDGGHFGVEGNQWTANWVNDHLIKKGVLI